MNSQTILLRQDSKCSKKRGGIYLFKVSATFACESARICPGMCNTSEHHFWWYEIARVLSAGIDQKAIFPPHLDAPAAVLLIQPRRRPSPAISIRWLFFLPARARVRPPETARWRFCPGRKGGRPLFMVQLKLGPLKNACRTFGRYLAAGGELIWACT